MDVDEAIEKAVMVSTKDPDEVAATLRKGPDDPVGGVYGDHAWVYKWSLLRYRELKRNAGLRSGSL